MHEWPLFIFTLLMHASIGCMIIAFICCLRFLQEIDNTKQTRAMRLPLLTSFVFSVLGLLASVFHLGNPMHMFYAITHVDGSWMSREIVLTGLFMGLLFLNCVLLLFKQTISKALLALCALAGLIAIFAMSQLYANSIFPLWNIVFTGGQFYGTMLLLGSVFSGMTLLPAFKEIPSIKGIVLQTSLLSEIAGLAILLLSALSLLTQLGLPLSVGIEAKVLPQHLLTLSIARTVLVGIGLICLCKAFSVISKNMQQPTETALLAGGAICVIVGESLGRYTFFMLGA